MIPVAPIDNRDGEVKEREGVQSSKQLASQQGEINLINSQAKTNGRKVLNSKTKKTYSQK